MTTAGRDDRTGLVDSLLDLVVYAPIGLTLDAQSLAPDLARRGRQHTMAARQIGELAVRAGMRRLEDVISQMSVTTSPADRTPDATAPATPGASTADSTQAPPDGTQDPEAPPDDAAPAAVPTPVSVEALAVPDYDLLAASQVVKRLDGLTAAELEMVRQYEEATRGRRTILHKIARLQG